MNNEQIGSDRFFDEVKAVRDVLPLLNALLKDYGTENFAFFKGAVFAALHIISKGEAAGMKFKIGEQTIEPASALAIDVNRAVSNHDLSHIQARVEHIASAVNALIARGSISFPNQDKSAAQIERDLRPA